MNNFKLLSSKNIPKHVDYTLAGAYRAGSLELVARSNLQNLSVKFRVMRNRKMVYQTYLIDYAISRYNRILPKV